MRGGDRGQGCMNAAVAVAPYGNKTTRSKTMISKYEKKGHRDISMLCLTGRQVV